MAGSDCSGRLQKAQTADLDLHVVAVEEEAQLWGSGRGGRCMKEDQLRQKGGICEENQTIRSTN